MIGNLTRDPELRYTPKGTAVCTFGLATNRSWVTESGEKKEEVEFHRIVAWNKLAELCAQLLFKGRRVYVEGRLQTRSWAGQDGAQRQTTEVVINDMMILDSRKAAEEGGTGEPIPEHEFVPEEIIPEEGLAEVAEPESKPKASTGKKKAKEEAPEVEDEEKVEEVKTEDIPF